MKTGDYVFWVFCSLSCICAIVKSFDAASIFIVGAGVVLTMNAERSGE
jgi:hypothetical protein